MPLPPTDPNEDRRYIQGWPARPHETRCTYHNRNRQQDPTCNLKNITTFTLCPIHFHNEVTRIQAELENLDRRRSIYTNYLAKLKHAADTTPAQSLPPIPEVIGTADLNTLKGNRKLAAAVLEQMNRNLAPPPSQTDDDDFYRNWGKQFITEPSALAGAKQPGDPDPQVPGNTGETSA